MKAKCFDCGHEWERKAWAKSPVRCSKCKSSNAEIVPDLVVDSNPPAKEEQKKVERSPERVKARNGERRRYMENELKHAKNQELAVNTLREGSLGFLGILDSKNPKGHFQKGIMNVREMLKHKRELREAGYDDRCLGENIRKLKGKDEGGPFGFGIIKMDKGGILGLGLLGGKEE